MTPERDILKLVFYNRYRPAVPAVAFVIGFGVIPELKLSDLGLFSLSLLPFTTTAKRIAK